MTVTIDELLAGIRKTREGMSLSYDDLNIDVVWMTADMPRLRWRIERANRSVKPEDPA
jgi:hypothetical protein